MEKLVNKQTPHGACKCFCTTCKAFLEVASKKTGEGGSIFKNVTVSLFTYVTLTLFSLHHSGKNDSGGSSPDPQRAGREGGRVSGVLPPTIPTDMGPASHSHHPSIGRG